MQFDNVPLKNVAQFQTLQVYWYSIILNQLFFDSHKGVIHAGERQKEGGNLSLASHCSQSSGLCLEWLWDGYYLQDFVMQYPRQSHAGLLVLSE